MAMRWTAELKKIERQFDGLPPKPSPAAVRLQKEVQQRSRLRREERWRAVGTWGRIVLVAALAIGVTAWWPYPHQCGRGLLGRVGVEGLVALGGAWVMGTTWRERMAFAHTVAVGLVVWGAVTSSADVLGRMASAAPTRTWVQAWDCR